MISEPFINTVDRQGPVQDLDPQSKSLCTSDWVDKLQTPCILGQKSLKPGDIFYEDFWHESNLALDIRSNVEEEEAAVADSTSFTLDFNANGTDNHHSAIDASAVIDCKRKPFGEVGARNSAKNRWTKEEHAKFLEGLNQFSPCHSVPFHMDGTLKVGLGSGVAEQIAKIVGTRSAIQVRSHAQKYFVKLYRKMAKQARGLQG
ncbi:hypothetical protein GUITHDRAFT_119771 [Guillardia theta CCMP2712]|uniref:Myb-like domain-containing protein n=1 Tax=Guillardia theta (strain CCMP2712) TaxID=905079 RepID=L1ICQ3_GUITC|nr:hypothetical protein GUITHDRAFT_119771 [Guillardia theta CCMP2712]EKX34031.1 hypothetical protein GUITHDRAFT_119771 [Guillardia theta CCMP2712]|eukprot:XP_005821011.1 hypothetical protein GUITHDRAFT_119771 [Guillardia theta CCMP2712]